MTSDKFIEYILFFIAFSTIAIIALITLFIFIEGSPVIGKTGIIKFVFGKKWEPTKNFFGILPMIIGTFMVTGGALLLGVPLGLGCAIFLAEFAPKRASTVLKPAIELLAGIPSVVYGFIGLVILVPIIRDYLGGPGFSVLASSLVLTIMILPTIISISVDSIKAVPQSYREGSIALGATKWQTVIKVIIPAAKSGIIASIILGMGRAVGETMAVIMVAGNATKIVKSPLDPVRTLTSNIALGLGYATGIHRNSLFATGIILFVIIMALNLLTFALVKRR